MLKTYRYKLDPNRKPKALLSQTLDAARRFRPSTAQSYRNGNAQACLFDLNREIAGSIPTTAKHV
jgi:hypothetical protein